MEIKPISNAKAPNPNEKGNVKCHPLTGSG
jgi:hypothetical protein